MRVLFWIKFGWKDTVQKHPSFKIRQHNVKIGKQKSDGFKGRKMFLVDRFRAILKFFIVDSIVNVLGDLIEQPIIMWIFIGWGWISVWVMLFSIYDTIGQL